MKAGLNKENNAPNEILNIKLNASEMSPAQKPPSFCQEKTPDRPIHRRIPSIVSKDFKNGYKYKAKGKKSLEIDRKYSDQRFSPFSQTVEFKSSIASTDVRGHSLFSSEIEPKKKVVEKCTEAEDSITEKLTYESYCKNCEKYVYTKVTFNKSE